MFLPGRGEARRTVTVSPGTADEKRRVQVVIPFEGSDAAATRAAKRQSVISLKELQVSDKARKAFEDAQGKLGKDNVAGAIVDLQRAVELSPVFTDAWNNLGTIAYQGGRYPDAEKYFRQALEHEPGAYAPVVNLGGVLLNLGHPAEALKYNEYAVEQQPDDALAHSQLGMSLATLGEAERAEKHLLEAIRLDPAHFSHPQLVLARLYAGQGKRKAAAGQLEDFLKRHPDDPKTEQIRQQLEALQK